jgi:plasmid stabilization system protein ParE
MNVQWTEQAIRHLTAIRDYIAQTSPRHAQGMVDRITRRSQQLAIAPELGGMVMEYADPQIREVVEPPYRIIYQVGTDQVDVLAVIHGARLLPHDLV